MTESRAQLNAALEIFERLRARPWVDRASAELRATGQTKPRAGDSILDRLTPQEFEIVSLAASGLTNKQIAERLFLSPPGPWADTSTERSPSSVSRPVRPSASPSSPSPRRSSRATSDLEWDSG
jgi:Bacterial regulatory proteins, luxR family